MLNDGQAAATIPVTDMARARAYYADTLGFHVDRESEGGILFTAGQGTAFFVYPSQFAGTNKATAMSFNVSDFDATVEDLRGKGVTFLEYDFPGLKTENGIAQTTEGPGAWWEDPDGNILAVAAMA